jgi:negative regulator of sigma E activity
MPPSRTQVRDHLGRFARASRGPARRALAGAGRLALAALRADLARRLYRLGVAAVVLAATVVLLYQYGDGPALERAAQPAAAPVTTAHPTRAGSPAPSGRSGGGSAAASRSDPERPKAAPAPAAATAGRAATPAAAAAAWYAHREGVDASLVRSLQQDRVSSHEVRVLVLADHGRGRIDTALVTVRRDAAGGWAVR